MLSLLNTYQERLSTGEALKFTSLSSKKDFGFGVYINIFKQPVFWPIRRFFIIIILH